MADHNLPTVTSTYSNFVTELDARLDDMSKMFDVASLTNVPVNTIRWDSTLNRWRKWSGTAWLDLATSYTININGTVGATTPNTGSFTTITTSGLATLNSATVGGASVVSVSAAQTLTNKTLTSPIISQISNTGTLTLPTSSDTLVGRATTDTLTNKTLTAPRFADLGFIADPNGNEMLEFDSVASAVNYIRVANSATGTLVSISAQGDDTNVSLNLLSKGTGTVQANGIAIANISTAQTLTNKTLGTGSTWNGNTIGAAHGGTGNTANFVAGGIIYGFSSTVLTSSAAGSAGQLLQSNGTGAPSWVSASTLSVASAASAASATSANNATTVANLAVHSGRNNEANRIVRTDGSGYLQTGYINSSNGNEGNNTSPPRVWGTNGSDDYLRTYLTSALSVGFATNAGFATSAGSASTAGNGGVTSVNSLTGAVSWRNWGTGYIVNKSNNVLATASGFAGNVPATNSWGPTTTSIVFLFPFIFTSAPTRIIFHLGTDTRQWYARLNTGVWLLSNSLINITGTNFGTSLINTTQAVELSAGTWVVQVRLYGDDPSSY